jgi:arylsulfatase A-like enzyme
MMNRREFLRSTVAASAAAMSGRAFAMGMDGKKPGGKLKRPNIVYLMADQLRYQSCGYAGDEKAITPNIDRMASEGIDFRQAVSHMPVCSAYRASLFTGKHVSSTGMVINELRMNPDHRCFGHVLTDGGYETGYFGKWHLYANVLGRHREAKNSFVPRGKHRLGFDGYWAAFNFHHNYYGEYYHTESLDKIRYGDGVYEPDAQTDQAIDYIEKNADSGKPFCMVVSYGTPHDPWIKSNVPAEYYEMFKDVKFDVPPNWSDEMDPYGDAWSNTRKSPEKLDEWMRNYYAMTTNLDHNIGRVIEAIDEAGLGEDTIIVFTSDHGEMFGAQGRMKKNVFYEEAARIPFLMRCTGRIAAGQVSDVCLNTPDIMPTLLSMAGLGKKIPKEVEGMDLSHVAFGSSGDEPEAAFLMNTGACAMWEDGHEWRALRSKDFTYAVFKGGGKKDLPKKELLFDNVNDPYQMKNLVGSIGHKGTLGKFRNMLKDKMTELNDTFPASSWYRENWIDDNRNVIASAMGKFKE